MAAIDHSVYFGLALEDDENGQGGNLDWATGATKAEEGNLKYNPGTLMHLYEARPKMGMPKGVNTWEDWHLIPASRPEIVPPEVYTNYVDLPGCHGKLDLSEYLTGYPVYKNRSGTLEFYAANGYGFWAERYNQICNFLHGKKLFMVLYDEPEYFYTGRFRVQKYVSDGQTNWSSVSIDYELDPFKFVLPRTSRDEYWERFLFEDIWPYEFVNKVNAATGQAFTMSGYTNGFMLDGFIDESSTFPASATVQVNDQAITLSRVSADSHTVRSGTLLPVTTPTNTITITGSGLVDLVCWGGHL